MIKAILNNIIRGFERRYDYNAAYLHEIIDAKTGAGLKMTIVSSFLTEDFGAPRNLYHAAKIRSVRRADCGPCLRLVLGIAEDAGVSPSAIRTALEGGEHSPEAALGARFADAVLDNSPNISELAETIRQQYGADTVCGLAVAINAGQFYPILKRAMGYAATCEPVVREYLSRPEIMAAGAIVNDEKAA